MANILNTMLANQPIENPAKQENMPAFTFSSEGRIRPMKDKGKLLPSKIFGSPIEYAKDLKKDIVSIGKAADGKANDHELGRINDLAMKLGSLGLATYLFVKNPLKLSKTMEFVGLTTFFTSMALWPKLAIQAPLKARTGVDIHQKYVDSQGRKKMLFQDPQYVLTDLYSKDDLNKIGDKLGVSKNIEDRDNFIKQRAQKTAVQGNTLWMLSSGFAAPIMSALACNVLEKPVGDAIEKVSMATSQSALEKLTTNGLANSVKSSRALDEFKKYLAQNSDAVIDEAMAIKLANKMGIKTDSAALMTAIKEELLTLKNPVKINLDFARGALRDKVPAKNIEEFIMSETLKKLEGTPNYSKISTILKEKLMSAPETVKFNADFITAALSEQVDGADIQQVKDLLGKTLTEETGLKNIADSFAKLFAPSKRKHMQLSDDVLARLTDAKKNLEAPTVGQFKDRITVLYSNMADFGRKIPVLNKFINARVGDQSGTYIANQWGKFSNKFIKSLGLTSKELKAVSQGNMDIVNQKLQQIAANPTKYDKVVSDLMKIISDYESVTSSAFISKVDDAAGTVFSSTARDLRQNGFSRVADKVSSSSVIGSLENTVKQNTMERISGAKSSFYRLIQTLDLHKKLQNVDASKVSQLEKQIAESLAKNNLKADKSTIDKLTQACKDILMNATPTDYVEKLKSIGFDLSQGEYKTVMQVLFGTDIDTTILESVKKTAGVDKASGLMTGFDAYKNEFMTKVANWRNGITPELSRCVVNGENYAPNAIARANLAGKPIRNLVQDAAKQAYNSKKWIKIFGGSMAALTAVTLVAGLAIGRKGKIEKQVEAESKQNG